MEDFISLVLDVISSIFGGDDSSNTSFKVFGIVILILIIVAVTAFFIFK